MEDSYCYLLLTPQKLLVEPTWSKEETDHLMDLAKTFDCRFIVIHDRFGNDKFQVKKIIMYTVCGAYFITNASLSKSL